AVRSRGRVAGGICRREPGTPERSGAATVSLETGSWNPLRRRADNLPLRLGLPATAETGNPHPDKRHVDRRARSSTFALLVRPRPPLRRPSTGPAGGCDDWHFLASSADRLFSRPDVTNGCSVAPCHSCGVLFDFFITVRLLPRRTRELKRSPVFAE